MNSHSMEKTGECLPLFGPTKLSIAEVELQEVINLWEF